MRDKKKTIIETSVKLFSRKGFHAVSIQEIAKQSNVSKGAFYLYFDSKEDLALSIFQYYTDRIWNKLEEIKQLDKEPKEKLQMQIETFLDILSAHKEYFMLVMRENISFGDKLEVFIHQMNEMNYRWASGNLQAIYGEKITPYIGDGVIQMDGLMHSYFKYIVFHKENVDTNKLAAFIVERICDVVEGMMKSERTSSLSFKWLTESDKQANLDKEGSVYDVASELILILNQLDSDESEKMKLKEAANVIHEEAKKEQPNPVLIQGMLSHFQNVPETRQACQKMARLLNIRLL